MERKLVEETNPFEEQFRMTVGDSEEGRSSQLSEVPSCSPSSSSLARNSSMSPSLSPASDSFTTSSGLSLSPPVPVLPPSPSFHTPSFAQSKPAPSYPYDSKARFSYLSDFGGRLATISSSRSFRGTDNRLNGTAEHNTPRRLKWSSLLIPLLLILIGASARWMMLDHDTPDLLGLGVHNHHGHHNFDTGDRIPIHRRHPTPNPIPGEEGISIILPSSSTPSSTSSASSSGTGTPTSTGSVGVPTIPSTDSPPILPTPFPQPWDGSSLPLNFSTQGCFDFFQNMTNTEPFRSCRNFGMLEAWSSSFVNAQTNITLLNSILWGTCNPPLGADQCTVNMRWFERQMVQVCAKEFQDRNDMVVRTRAALLSYPLLLTTSCLALSNTNTYCYVSSIAAGPSGASDIYLYNLPLGLDFPDGTRPTCGACAKNLLGAFGGELKRSVGSSSSSTNDGEDPLLNLDDTSSVIGLKSTYQGTVNTIESTCGAGFVQVSGPESSHANGGSRLSSKPEVTVVFALGLVVLLVVTIVV